jgi:hypothetical protein
MDKYFSEEDLTFFKQKDLYRKCIEHLNNICVKILGEPLTPTDLSTAESRYNFNFSEVDNQNCLLKTYYQNFIDSGNYEELQSYEVNWGYYKTTLNNLYTSIENYFETENESLLNNNLLLADNGNLTGRSGLFLRYADTFDMARNFFSNHYYIIDDEITYFLPEDWLKLSDWTNLYNKYIDNYLSGFLIDTEISNYETLLLTQCNNIITNSGVTLKHKTIPSSNKFFDATYINNYAGIFTHTTEFLDIGSLVNKREEFTNIVTNQDLRKLFTLMNVLGSSNAIIYKRDFEDTSEYLPSEYPDMDYFFYLKGLYALIYSFRNLDFPYPAKVKGPKEEFSPNPEPIPPTNEGHPVQGEYLEYVSTDNSLLGNGRADNELRVNENHIFTKLNSDKIYLNEINPLSGDVVSLNGNFGIGISSSDYRLYVLGNTAINSRIRVERSNNTFIDLIAGSNAYGAGLVTEDHKIFLTTNGDITNPQFLLDSVGIISIPFQPFVYARQLVSTQTLTKNSNNNVVFESVVNNIQNGFDGTVFTAPESGKYLIIARILYDETNTVDWYGNIRIRSDSSIIHQNAVIGKANQYTTAEIFGICNLSKNAGVYIQTYPATQNDIDLLNFSNATTNITIFKIG